MFKKLISGAAMAVVLASVVGCMSYTERTVPVAAPAATQSTTTTTTAPAYVAPGAVIQERSTTTTTTRP